MFDIIKKNCHDDGINKVFTFGIGDRVDQDLVKQSAINGKGDYCFVKDGNLSLLKTKVIEMLQKASEPGL